MTRWLTIGVLGGLAAWTFPAMADAALKGTCLLAIVLAAEMVLRRRSAAVRHLLLVASFGLLLALPVLTLVLPGWQVLPEWLHVPAVEEPPVTAESDSRAAPAVLDSAATAPIRVVDGFDHEANFNGTRTDRLPATSAPFIETEWSESPTISAGPATVIESADQPPITSSGALTPASRNVCVLAWLAGTALLLLRVAFGAGLLWRARRRATLITDGPLYQLLQGLRGELALRRPVRLYLGSNRAMPMAWGLWRACILVPGGIETWAPSQQRAVLLHELGHVARRDPLWQLIVELGRALYWFHPLVWLAAWRVHVEREQACDDLVISRGVAAQDYARHLLDVVSRGRLRTVRPAIGVAMASTHKLEGRVRSILDGRRNRRPVTRNVAVAGLLACVAIGLPLAMMRAADEGSTAEVSEQAAEATTADTDTDLSANNPDVPTIELDSPEDITRRVRELLYTLREFRVFSRSDEWGGAMRELIEIGKPAVPELVAELDRTDRDETLSALGFVLRGIGDPRAAPALIRTFPKLLRAPRSDYGIHIHDPELRAFLKQHERYQSEDSSVAFGRPVNEILDTLQKLTGHSEPPDGEDDPLRHVTLGGGREQRARAREAYAARQARWEQWWSEHRLVTDEVLKSLELPPRDGDSVAEAGLARFGPLFPTGPDVRLGPVQEVELDSYSYWDAPSHFDFDTGRIFQYLEDAEQLEPEAPGDTFSIVVNWPPAMGIDVRGNEGDDLYVWQIDNERWDTIEDEVHRNEPLPLGPEATDWLVRFDQDRTDFQYDQIGTFLITTREGGRGIVQSHPRDVLTGKVKLRYRMWIDEQHPESQPPHERPRDATGPAFGEPVTLKLQTPGRGKPFLLDLDTGQAVTPPDSIVPADATPEFWYSDSEPFAEWCREKGIDLATRLSQYETGTTELQQAISLIGLQMVERNLLPDAFDTMSVPEAWEILHRLPETSEYAWISTTADIAHQPDTFIIRTRAGRMALLRIWESAEDGSSITIHYRLAPAAQNQQRGNGDPVIRGQVLDSSRRPIAGAGVWLPVDLVRDDLTVHTTTDVEGRFELAAPDAWRNEANFPGRTVWVWHAAHGLNMADVWSQLHGDRTDEFIITLARPEAEAPFDVIRPDGTPAADAPVTPLHFTTPNGEYIPAPPGLREKLQQSADAQGRVTFRTVPPELLNSVQVDADGFGTQVLHLSLEGYEERDRQIVLGAAGRIEGRIETDDPALLDGLTLYFETRDPGWLDPFWTSRDEDEIERRLNEGDHPRKTRATAAAPVGADGQFAVPAIAEGRLVMYSNRDEAGINGIRLTDVVVDVEAGRRQEIAVNVAPRVAVRGRVVNGETGEPVPAAIISIHDGEGQGERVATDENGQFNGNVLAGRVDVVVDFVRNAPDGWRQISESRVVVAPTDSGEVTLPEVVIGEANEISARSGGIDDTASARILVTYDIPDADPDARVFVRDLDRGRDIGTHVEGFTTNGATWELNDLEPGRYQVSRRRLVEIGRVGDQRIQNWIHFDRRTLTLTAGETKRIHITLPNGKPVVGHVPGMENLGVERAIVYVCSDNATGAESLSDLDVTVYDVQPCNADGEFVTERLSPGTYMFIVEGYAAIPPEALNRTGEIPPRFVGTAHVIVPDTGQPPAVEVTLVDTRNPEFGSLSIEYDVIGGPPEATFMLNLSKRATPDPGAGIEERDVRVVNGESKVVERLIPGTYQLARIKPIRFPDFSKLCWLDYREVVIEPDQRTETRFVRGEGRPVRGRVLGLRERVGNFGQDGSQDGAGVRETLACVLVRGADAPDPELVGGPPWHPDFDVAPCRPDGRFTTAPLEPGTYTLYAHAYRRLTDEQRVRTGDILPSWRGAATVTVPEEGEPEFVEITLEPFEREPAVRTDGDDGPNADGGESQPGGPTSQVAPAERPLSFAGEIDLRELVATLLPNHRLRLDDQDAPTALVSPESGELKIPAGGDVEGGPIGYWVSPAMTFLSDARPDVSDAAAAARLIQLLHALCKGPDFVRQKIYRPRAIDNGWLVEVDHDFENFPGMIPFIHPYELLADKDNRVTSLRQRSNVYLGNGEVYVDTITTVYEREVRVNRGINYPEVLEEELKQAWARERGVPLEHNSLAHYPNAVISVTDEDTGERFYVESNGARLFFLNSDGATVRIIDPVRATDLEHLVGAPVVRHLELRGPKLLATVGKHTLVTIDRASGEIESVVSD